MPDDPSLAVSIGDVRAAADRISPHVLRTPLVACERLSRRFGCDVRLKAENLQHGGAFKARGATHAVLRLGARQAERGVVTHSSGNHAAALARAAAIRGIPAHVVMPENASPIKIAAVRRYGVEPTFCPPTSADREAAATALQQRTGGTLIHPFDAPPIIAGQGTVGLEMLEQCDQLDTILAPVGGGGLLGGMLIAVKALRPSIEVIAVEPAWADDTARSLKSGTRQPATRYDTVADGLRTEVGQHTFPIIRRLVDDLILVAEDAIGRATRRLAEEAHLVAEPSGAVALAALESTPERFNGRTVGIVISGGNLDFGACLLGQSGPDRSE
jgi:threonine dehydratase